MTPPIKNVVIVSPADGDTVYATVNSPIAVAFDDTTSAFDHLEIFTNGISLGQTTNTFFNWVPTQTNQYVLTATGL